MVFDFRGACCESVAPQRSRVGVTVGPSTAAVVRRRSPGRPRLGRPRRPPASSPCTIRAAPGDGCRPGSSACRSSTRRSRPTPAPTPARSTRCSCSSSAISRPARRRCCGSAATAPIGRGGRRRAIARPAGVTFAITDRWLEVTRALAQTLARAPDPRPQPRGEQPGAGGVRGDARSSTGSGPRAMRALELGNEPDLYSTFPWYRTPDGRP